MKKSKLIVPAALAVMLLSTAASVTGTVAWFTANRKVDINTGTFEVSSTDGNLNATLFARANTSVDNATKTVTVDSGKTFTDASVNVSFSGATPTVTVWSDQEGSAVDAQGQPTTYETKAAPYQSEDETVIYCASWDIKFNYEFPSATGPVNLFFDLDSTIAKLAEDTNDLETGRGFRIAVVSDDGYAIVFGNDAVLGNYNYVTSASALAVAKVFTGEGKNTPDYHADGANKGKVENDANYSGAYTEAALASRTNTDSTRVQLVRFGRGENDANTGTQYDQSTFPKATNGSASQTSRGDYIGTFTSSGSNKAAAVTAVAGAALEANAAPVSGTKYYTRAENGENDNAGYLNDGSYKYTLVDSGNIAAQHEANIYYTLTNEGFDAVTSSDVLVHCYAWFEGTDPYIVNASEMNKVTSNLKFYTRTAPSN